MTNITETPVYTSGIYQLETDDPVLGGEPGFNLGVPVAGHSNAQAQQLANRTAYLKERIDGDLADSSDPLNGAGMVGFSRDFPPTEVIGNVGQFLSVQPLNLWEFADLAIGYGVGTSDTWDWTPAIQAFVDAVDAGPKVGYMPAGYYNADQIEVPNGIKLYGAGLGNYGKGPAGDDATVLRQNSGVNDDFIIFKPVLTGGFLRVGPIQLFDFVLLGNTSNTSGHGISFRQAGSRLDDANHAIIQATTRIENLLIREFPENGMFMRRGGVPVGIRNVNCLFNGGYGIRYEGLNTGRTVLFESIDGDGNKGGAVIYIASAASNSCFNIYNARGEYRTNAAYGVTTGFSGAQPYLIEIGDCATQSVVNIFGGSLQSSVDILAPVGREQADAFVKMSHTSNATMPLVSMFGLVNVNQGGVAGNSYLLKDTLNSVNIPGTVKSAVYTQGANPLSIGGTGVAVFGNNATLSPVGVGSEGLQVKGLITVISHHETDAAADAKTWTEVASAGELTNRTVTDAGVATIYRRVRRSGGTATEVEYLTPMDFQSTVMVMTLPTFADNAAATGGGLAVGRVYKTATGEVRIVV